MTTYGNTSRISVTVEGGGISAINLDTAEKVVVFANGDPQAGSVSVNSPTEVSGPGALASTYGSGEDIVEYIRDVAAQGIPYDLIRGVVPEQLAETNEDITGGGEAADHTGGSEISNAPLVEDTSLITVEDDQSNSLTVEFRYETNKDSTNSDFTGLSPGSDTIYINPNTGEWVADASDNYNITYEYLDWSSAFSAATGVVQEQEVGTWYVGSEAQAVVNTAQSEVDPLRTNEWKMIKILAPTEPNASSSDNDGELSPGDYSNSVDADATFVTGPARLLDSTLNAGAAVAGLIGANSIDNPIIGDELLGVDDLEQDLSVPDQETLEGENIIPLSDTGTVRVEGNLGTSSASDWTRTVFSRKLADRLILAARAVARTSRGKLNNSRIHTIVEQRVADEIRDLIDQGVLRPNGDGETRWSVDAARDPNNDRELDVSLGFTPTGVVDSVEVTQTINY